MTKSDCGGGDSSGRGHPGDCEDGDDTNRFNMLRQFLFVVSGVGADEDDDGDAAQPKAKDAVVLSTMHKAKGLEWRYRIYLCFFVLFCV